MCCAKMSFRRLQSRMFGNRSSEPYEIGKSSKPSSGPSVADVVIVVESSDEEFHVPERMVKFNGEVKGRDRDSSPGPSVPIVTSTPSDPRVRNPLYPSSGTPYVNYDEEFPPLAHPSRGTGILKSELESSPFEYEYDEERKRLEDAIHERSIENELLKTKLELTERDRQSLEDEIKAASRSAPDSYFETSKSSKKGTGNQDGKKYVTEPATFDGTGWESYKLHFLSCVQANQWSQMEAANILGAHLVGDAAIVLAQRPLGTWSLDELVKAIEVRYEKAGPDYVIKHNLRSVMQTQGQTLQQYADVCHKAVWNKLGDIAEENKLMLEQFFYGLIDPRAKKMLAKRKPKTIQEALEMTREQEATNLFLEDNRSDVHVKTTTESVENKEEGVLNADLRKRVLELEQELRRSKAVERSNVGTYRNNNSNNYRGRFNNSRGGNSYARGGYRGYNRGGYGNRDGNRRGNFRGDYSNNSYNGPPPSPQRSSPRESPPPSPPKTE